MNGPLQWEAPRAAPAPEAMPLEFAATEESHFITGFWLFIASDVVLFACLFATFLVYRGANLNMGPMGVSLPVNLTAVMEETVLLLTSSFTCSLAVHEMRRGHRRALSLLLGATLLLGLGFVGLELHDFGHLLATGYAWSRSSFLSSFFVLVATHGGHVSFGILWGIALLIQLGIHGLGAKSARKVYTFALYWHFLDIIWVFIFTVVFLTSTLR